MTVIVEAADEKKVPYEPYRRHSACSSSEYFVGDLPSIRTKLYDAGVHKNLKIYAVFRDKRFGIEWSNAGGGLYVSKGIIEIKDGHGAIVLELEILEQRFPPFPSGTVWSDDSGRESYTGVQVRVRFELAVDAPGSADSMAALIDGAALAMIQQTQSDVCWVFPDSNGNLWASSRKLRATSPYFETLLASTFEEGQVKLDPDSPPIGRLRQRDFDDSDDETDDLVAEMPPTAPPPPETVCGPHRVVRVSQTARTLYAALLLWITTRTIDFAPLRSSGHPARQAHVTQALQERPNRPAPASPKSIYRLAHLLDLEELTALALANFKSELTVTNAAFEAFTDAAGAYSGLRDAAVDFIVANRTAVKASPGWQTIEQRADEGSLPPASVYSAILLARRLA